MSLDHTHDPALRSWVRSANGHGTYPIQNLPFGVFRRDREAHVGVAIGDQILDLTALEAAGRLRIAQMPVFNAGNLNAFMALGRSVWRQTRRTLHDLLSEDRAALGAQFMVAQAAALMELPFFVRSFTDFYASRAHATNVGAMFRDPDKALMPNWLHMPVGYNGRASGVVVSGTEITRPTGQVMRPGADAPDFAASGRLDLEVELGAVVGTGTAPGARLSPKSADDAIFGYVLLNDWSARDLQVWEYQPLGPFLSKAFATTISPWVVTTEALAPFRAPMPTRAKPLLPYLSSEDDLNFDIRLEVSLAPDGEEPTVLCQTNAKYLYYAPAQMLAHHASSGAPMCTGDLLGSGTISGPDDASLGSMLEITRNGKEPVTLKDGSVRSFLQDGDGISISGLCDGPYSIGFGRCDGVIRPADGL